MKQQSEPRAPGQWREIAIEKSSGQLFSLWHQRWFLLSAGEAGSGDVNTMTVSWGSFGTMWNKPFAQVVVRPSRYTFQFMEKYDWFSLTAFAPQYRPALQMLGTVSGRDSDKISASGLHITTYEDYPPPLLAEANLAFICRKIYWQDMQAEHFLQADINAQYDGHDHHRIYFGEVMCILSSEDQYA
jgi:flavin reductase (DIM6/NTAB) family NADH-FMN oxidoreductase RutF